MKPHRHTAGSWLDTFASALGAIFFIVMFGAVTAQVFWRYALHDPLIWPMELSVYCYIYIVYLGSAMATRRQSHVRFDLISERMSPRARAISQIVFNLLIIAIILRIMPPTLSYIKFIGDVRSSALQIPWSWVLASFPLGMGLMVFHLGALTVIHIKELGAR